MKFLHSKNGTWAKSYWTRFLATKREKLKHIFCSVCAKIKEFNQGHSFFTILGQIVSSYWTGEDIAIPQKHKFMTFLFIILVRNKAFLSRQYVKRTRT